MIALAVIRPLHGRWPMPLLFCCLLLALGACGGRALTPSADGGSSDGKVGPSVDGTSIPTNDARRAGLDGIRFQVDGPSIPKMPRCVVAIRTDNCCQAPKPALVSEVESDPCLMPIRQHRPRPRPSPSCQKKWPAVCATMFCASPSAPSLSAAFVSGQCRYVDECQTRNDCMVAAFKDQCCACGDVFPKAMVLQRPCLDGFPFTQPDLPVPPNCSVNCDAVRCGPCPTMGPSQLYCSGADGDDRGGGHDGEPDDDDMAQAFRTCGLLEVGTGTDPVDPGSPGSGN